MERHSYAVSALVLWCLRTSTYVLLPVQYGRTSEMDDKGPRSFRLIFHVQAWTYTHGTMWGLYVFAILTCLLSSVVDAVRVFVCQAETASI